MTKKKRNSAKKKKNPKAVVTSLGEKRTASEKKKPASKTALKPTLSKISPKKVSEKKGEGGSIGQLVHKAGQFLRESKMELKKVKWPTRKELLAMTGVVLVLTLFCALFLGLVDFGLIKLIKNIVG